MPRFVIQHHELSNQHHWDLMLESGQALATWQVPTHPSHWADQPVICRQLAPHRLDYLTYQGPVSQNRGHVTLFAQGNYKMIQIEETCWQFILTGDKIFGQLKLEKLQENTWQLTFWETSGEKT